MFNYPDICNEAKLRVKDLGVWYQKDLCATAVGVCCSEAGLFFALELSMGIVERSECAIL